MKELININDNLRNYALSLTRDVHRANDLLQETNLKMLLTKGRYSDKDIRPIAFTTMRNTFINNVHYESRFTDNMPELACSEEPDNGVSFTYLQSVVNSLEASLSIPFIMHFEGYKYHEIAKDQGIPLGTVKHRIFQARKKLQKLLLTA